MAFVRREMYENMNDSGRLSTDDYLRVGGLKGGLGLAAEECIDSATLDGPTERDLQVAFLRMVRLTDDEKVAKRSVLWVDLPSSVEETMHAFVRARLLVSSGGDGTERSLAIAHEALFRQWSMLAEWIEENTAAFRARDEIGRAAEAWQNGERDRSYLIYGAAVGGGSRTERRWIPRRVSGQVRCSI